MKEMETMTTGQIVRVTPRLLAQTFDGTTERWWERRMARLRELKLIRKQGRFHIGDLGTIAEALVSVDFGSGERTGQPKVQEQAVAPTDVAGTLVTLGSRIVVYRASGIINCGVVFALCDGFTRFYYASGPSSTRRHGIVRGFNRVCVIGDAPFPGD